MDADARVEKRSSEQPAVGRRACGENVLVERELALWNELECLSLLDSPLAHAFVRATAEEAGADLNASESLILRRIDLNQSNRIE